MDSWFGEIHAPQAWRVYLATGPDFRDQNRACFGSIGTRLWLEPPTLPLYACINVKPEGGGGGTPGRCGAFDFSEEFVVKIPTMGPQNLVKSDQISSGVPSIYIENE